MPRYLPVVLAVVLFSGVSRAEQPPAPGTTKQPAPAASAPEKKADEEPRGQPVNVKMDLTITDQMGTGEPAKKTVSMIVADRSAGSIRSSGNNIRAMLNVDAAPQILPSGNIKVQLGLEYNPRQGGGPTTSVKAASGETVQLPNESGGSSLNQRVAIVLEPGKPLVMSQAADPLSDRKITVEVRATVLK